jgi:histidine triad (HIT) family protein
MSYDNNNIFARILRGEIPCRKVAENDVALAFEDIHPKAPTHILVIPKGAYQHLSDFCLHANTIEISGFWQLVGQISLDKNLNQAGYRMIANQGHNGGQEVPHFHVHLLGGRAMGIMVA